MKNLISKLKESIASLSIFLLPYITGCATQPVLHAPPGTSVAIPVGGWKDTNNNGVKDSYEFINPGKKVFSPGEEIGILVSKNHNKVTYIEQIVQYSLFDEKSNTYIHYNQTYDQLPPIGFAENRYCPITIPSECRDRSLKVDVTFILKRHVFSSPPTNLATSFLYNPPAQQETSIPKQSISP